MGRAARIAIIIVSATSCLLIAWRADADAIPGLFNTGVDEVGLVLADGATDFHYDYSAIISPSVPSDQCPACRTGPAVARPTDAAWIAPPSGSKWIGPVDDNKAPGSSLFIYTLNFDLTGLDPSTATISGDWSSDNGGVISINGVDTSFNTGGQSSQPFRSLHGFTIGDGFVGGMNELTFSILNGGGPTSLLVANITGSAALIPEPGTGVLLMLGLLGLASLGGKRW